MAGLLQSKAIAVGQWVFLSFWPDIGYFRTSCPEVNSLTTSFTVLQVCCGTLESASDSILCVRRTLKLFSMQGLI